jgi:superfamily II DNA or RNA helicase
MQLHLGIAKKPQKEFKPREYQTEFIKSLYRLFNQGIKKVLGVAPTGAGKTFIASLIIKDAVSRGRSVLFLIHRDVLAEQTAETLRAIGVDCGFIMGSKKANPDAKVQVASYQTLARRDIPDFDLIFYDEAHLTAFSTVGKKLLQRDCWHVGLTATPWRLKKTEGMGDLFESLIHTPLPYQLMEMGYLVKPRYFTLPGADLSGVKITAGDYNTGDLGTVCNQFEVIESLVNNWLNIAQNKRTIVFAVNVDHAKAIADHFNQKGIVAKAVYGDMPLKDREIIYQELRDGKTQIISSCEALAEGFDVPSIECVCLARPTKSKAKYFQQTGRGLRISPNKSECLILDQAGLIKEFGLIEDLTFVSLINGKEKKPCTTFCQGCGCGVLPGMKFCPRCAEGQLKIKNLPIGEMKELIVASGKKRQYDYYQLRLKRAYYNGHSPGKAYYEYQKHYNEKPNEKWALGAVFGDEPTLENKINYFNYLNRIAVASGKTEKWIKFMYWLQFGEKCEFEVRQSLQVKELLEMF